mmetsp:Transcript_42825/g.101899  ORF Transcript_42825/g.101899 Transcript_42825/m.101899 type:complete len:218 (-) Transcript_42825:676-1329(-)
MSSTLSRAAPRGGSSTPAWLTTRLTLVGGCFSTSTNDSSRRATTSRTGERPDDMSACMDAVESVGLRFSDEDTVRPNPKPPSEAGGVQGASSSTLSIEQCRTSSTTTLSPWSMVVEEPNSVLSRRISTVSGASSSLHTRFARGEGAVETQGAPRPCCERRATSAPDAFSCTSSSSSGLNLLTSPPTTLSSSSQPSHVVPFWPSSASPTVFRSSSRIE